MTDEQLNEIERLAGLFIKPADIALIVGLTAKDLEGMINFPQTDEFKAYYKGKLISMAELRKSVITLAKQGSSPAQSLAAKMLDDMNMDELDR